MPKKHRKQHGSAVLENRAKRWIRQWLASDEARMGMVETKSEMSLISTRVTCGVLFGLLFITFGGVGYAPIAEYIGWVGMLAVTTWAVLCGAASDWERQYQRDVQAADQEDYDKSIRAGNKMFQENIFSSADDRAAALKLTRNLKKVRDSDLEKFQKAIRKELFGSDSDDATD